MATLKTSPKFIDGCSRGSSNNIRSATRYRRRESTPRICSSGTTKYQKQSFRCSRHTRLLSHSNSRERLLFNLALALSVMVLMLAACNSTIRDTPMLVNAFVQNSYSRHSAAQWNAVMQNKKHHIRQLPNLPHRRTLSPLLAKKRDTENNEDSSEKEQSSSFGGFFRRKDNGEASSGSEDNLQESNKEEGSSKDIPIVGRFFSTEEEKEEKRRIKKEEKEEKERLKIAAKEERQRQERERERNKDSNQSDSDSDEKTSNPVTGVKNYFRERQIRKDSEVLRFQVMRMEEEKKKQQEKDAQELRLAALQKEEGRKQKNLAKQKKKGSVKVPTAPIAATDFGNNSEDIVRKKIQTQKEMDRKRKERLQKIRADKGNGVADPKKKPSEDGQQTQNRSRSDTKSKSQRLGGVVSAAQKFVSGVFEGKPEEWIVIAPKTRISPGEIVAVTAAGIDLLLIASKDGSAVHCVANSCPHLGTPLEIGSLERLPIESGPKSNSGPLLSQEGQNPGSAAKNSKNVVVQPMEKEKTSFFQEKDIASMLKQDGCEDCIVCPLHKTAFALKSGEVRGEWCPYPPVIGKLTGALKTKANLPVFDVRTKGKNIEIRLNTPVEIDDGLSKKKKKKR